MIPDLHSEVVKQRLKESDAVLLWTHEQLDGLKVPTLPHSKRVQLASACWHVAMEHAQAIVVLVHEGLFGSALALLRLLFEAFVRGSWLLHAATDADVDSAGRDQFPNDINYMIGKLEEPGGISAAGRLSRIKANTWRTLCSFTHTGYSQLGPRLTNDGLGYDYDDATIVTALDWADGLALATVLSFANTARNEQLALAALQRLREWGKNKPQAS